MKSIKEYNEYNCTHLTMMEVTEAFSNQINGIYKRKKKETNERLFPYYETLDEINNNKCIDKNDKDLLRMILKMAFQESLQCMERIESFKRMVMRIRNKEGRMSILPLLAVKQIPIMEAFTFKKIKRTGRRIMVSCPLHVDTTPSMLINLNNTWKCFSCQKSGSVIDLIMELYGFDFITAVKKLQEIHLNEKA